MEMNSTKNKEPMNMVHGKRIPIRNPELPKAPRVFDVTVDEKGEILRYDMQNIKGAIYINEEDVRRQIMEALSTEAV